jgi:hypothetical protein
MYTLPSPHDDAPYQALQQPLLDTVALLQTHPVVPKLRRAMKWFGNGVASQYPDDQFAYFWFVIEIVAQLIKEPTPVPDRCSRCRGPLFCEACGATHLHRPYAKQAIEQLFVKYGPKDELALYRRATDARNMLMHGDETKAIEEALKIEFARLVNDMGHLAWISILNQFVPVLINKRPAMLQTSQYVYLHMTGAAHMQLGFIPNFDNPDPAHFPKVHFGFSSPDEPPHPQP